MRKLISIFLILSLVGTVAASHETKSIWIPDGGECVEDIVDTELVVDPSFDTKEDCESYLDRNKGIKGMIFDIVTQVQIFFNSLF